jgi:hypothetical protein
MTSVSRAGRVQPVSRGGTDYLVAQTESGFHELGTTAQENHALCNIYGLIQVNPGWPKPA